MIRTKIKLVNKPKTRFVNVLIIIILIIGGFPLIFDFGSEHFIAKAVAITVNDDGGADFTSIQDAINASNPGDTIYVWAGIYNENVIVNETVTLIGNGSANTTINGGGSGDVLNITSDWVNITGFTLTNGNKGLYISSDYVMISNMNITLIRGKNGISGGTGEDGYIGVGIYLNSSFGSNISSNKIFNIDGGNGGDSNNNYITGGAGSLGAGIFLHTSTNSTIIKNTINTINGGTGGTGGWLGSGGTGGLGAGIYHQTSTNNTIINNTINTINGGTGGTGGSGGSDGTSQVGFGIFIDNNSLDNIIGPKNTLDGDEILYYYNQKGITIENYHLKSNSNPTNYGKIVLINCDDFTIKNNEIANFTGFNGRTVRSQNSGSAGGTGAGIYLQTSSNNIIINNTIDVINGGVGGTGGSIGSGGAGGHGAGIYLHTSTNNTIINNTIILINGGTGGTGGNGGSGGVGGTAAGTYLQTSTNNTIINNSINTINGGTGGTGGNAGSVGASQVGFGIFLDNNSLNNIIEPTNTMDGDEILYYYNQNGITVENYRLISNSNPINYGKIVLINCIDFIIKNNEVANFTGISGGTGGSQNSGSVGGLGAGIYLQKSTNDIIINNTINAINGGTGGTGGHSGSGSAGGLGAGIYLQTSTNSTIINNTINTINGKTGGTGGRFGSGGGGGLGSGIYLRTSMNNTIINNNITTIKGGTGGTGGGGFGSGGASQVGFGIFIDGNSMNNIIEPTNTMDGDEILYYYNKNGINIENHRLKSNSNPTNYGKIVLINCNDFTIKNNEIVNFTGISGETGGYMDSGDPGGLGGGIYLLISTNNTIVNNTITTINGGTGGTGGYGGSGGAGGLGSGIYLQTSMNNTIINNTINTINGRTGGTGGRFGSGGAGGLGSGIYLQISTNNTIINNTIKTIYGGAGGTGGDGGSGGAGGAGVGIYLQTSMSNAVINHNCSDNNHGIYLYSSSSNIIVGNIGSNNSYGIRLYSSSSNIITNCSISSNSIYDFYLYGNSKNNIAINSTFNTTYVNLNSELIVKNYLHIHVNDSSGFPTQDIDVEVKDNSQTIYATFDYGGTDPKTNVFGKIKWILVTDRIYNGSSTATENTTTVNVKRGGLAFKNNNRDVNMSTSHFEYFYANHLPTKVILKVPSNNSFVNDSLPELKWYAGTDTDGEPLTYFIEIDENGGNWSALVDSFHTSIGVLSWDVTEILIDGQSYQWRVRANDSRDNGSWSDVWKFTVDIDIPMVNTPTDSGESNNTGTVNWSWVPSLDTGSGIIGYYVCIGTSPGGNDIVDNAWTTNPWFEKYNLNDGNTYYCKIKVKNGAGTNSSYSDNSDGIFIDTDTPIANIPIDPGEYNTTGTVTWIWASSPDTGSGIIGYYVCIGTSPGDNDIVDNEWTLNPWFEKSDLMDGNTYYCKIKAKNGAGTNSSYSGNSDGIFIDTDIPIANIPMNPGEYNNTGMINWTWLPSTDTGSGIIGYYVNITYGTGGVIVDDVYTTNTWYQKSGLVNGETYYCKIKAKNGAGIVGSYSSNSDGILVDLDTPTPNTPVDPGDYNNTGTVRWTWQPSADTGSGIVGYYVCIGTMLGGNDVVNDGFTTNNWYEESGLLDGSTYYCKIKAKNGAGTLSDYSDNSNGIIIDTSPPASLSIIINNGDEYTNSASVILSLNAEDSGSGVYQMAFSPDGVYWTDWEPYNTSKSYVLLLGEGSKTVYFRVKDEAGNIAPYVFDSFKLDTTLPTVTSITLSDPSPTKAGTVTFTITFSENMSTTVSPTVTFGKTSPYDTHQITNLSYSDNTWTGTFEIDAITGDGTNTISVSNAQDLASNQIVLNASYIFVIDTTYPTVTDTLTGTDVEVTDTLTITFSEAMNHTSVENAITILPDVSISNYIWDGNTLTITFSSDLSYDTAYTVTIDTGANDEAGNALEEPHSWQFTTKAKSEEGFPLLWLIILLIIIVIIVLLLVWILMRRKPEELEEEELEEAEEEEIPPPPPKKAMIAELLEEGELEEAEEEVPPPPEKAAIVELSEEEEEEEAEEEVPPPPKKAKPRKKLSEEELDRLDLPEPDEEF